MSTLTPAQQAQLQELERSFTAALRLHENGRLDEAKPLYEGILRVVPRHGDALHLYGTLLHQQGLSDQAVGFLRQAVALSPMSAVYQNHLGAALRAVGQPAAALAAFRRATELRDDYVEAFLNVSIILSELGRPQEALPAAAAAARLAPTSPEAKARHGLSLKAAGRADAALAVLAGAISLDPLAVEPYLHLSGTHQDLGNREGQITSARKGIVLAPGTYEIYPQLTGTGSPEADALDCVAWARRATCLKALESRLWTHLSVETYKLNQFSESVRSAKRAIVIDLDEKAAYNNLATSLFHIGAYDQAFRFSRAGITAFPGLAELEFILCQAAFCTGDHKTGWRYWSARYRMEEAPARIGLPEQKWKPGEMPRGKLLVCSEQGVGDEIMFLSCLPDLLAEVGPVTVECDPRWQAIFQRSYPSVTTIPRQVCADGDNSTVYDYTDTVREHGFQSYVFCGDLPELYRRDLTADAPRTGYLLAEPSESAKWRRRLERLGPRPIIGLCWRSGLYINRQRSLHYADVVDLLATFPHQDCTLVSLQYGESAEEIERVRTELGVVIHDFPDLDQTRELDRVAGLMSGLDLVISPATAACQLACAVGVPTIGMEKSNFHCGDKRDPLFANLYPVMRHDEALDTGLAIARTCEAVRFFLATGHLPHDEPGNS